MRRDRAIREGREGRGDAPGARCARWAPQSTPLHSRPVSALAREQRNYASKRPRAALYRSDTKQRWAAHRMMPSARCCGSSSLRIACESHVYLRGHRRRIRRLWAGTSRARRSVSLQQPIRKGSPLEPRGRPGAGTQNRDPEQATQSRARGAPHAGNSARRWPGLSAASAGLWSGG